MNEATDLIFEEPPGDGRGGSVAGSSPLGRWLASLRDHPNQWAKFPERVHPSAKTSIVRGRAYGIEPGEYEAVGRDVSGSRCWLYARYVGAGA